MTDKTRSDNPYWMIRAKAEQMFESQGLVRGKMIDGSKGQYWHIKGGITFAIQWLGEQFDYVDSEIVAYILTGVSEWRAINPVKFS